MNRQRSIICVLFLVGLAAACPATPPAPPPAPRDTYVRVPFDSAWQGVIAYFADTRVPISTLDKASGLVVSRDFVLSFPLLKLWGDCGKIRGYPVLDQARPFSATATADFNVFLRPAGDSTAVRVNFGLRGFAMNGKFRDTPCVSNGKFEEGMIERIRKGPAR